METFDKEMVNKTKGNKMGRTFLEFVDHKEREGKRHLKILHKLFQSEDFETKEHINNDDPYIFITNPLKNASFDGIRIYEIGSTLAFRIQKEENCHPFGRAYQLDVEEMYSDLLTDHHKAEDAGKALVKMIAEEIKLFFNRQAKAENELKDIFKGSDPKTPFNRVAVKSQGMDYANLVTTRS
jgi:imidazoleglycerol phosphate dehydratase HisB